MNSQLLKALGAAALGPPTTLSLATAAQAQTAEPMTPLVSISVGGMQSGNGGPADMKQSMLSGMDSMRKMQMSGERDKDFAMMRKIHHQTAVNMSEMGLVNGKSPFVKALAKKINAAQKKEIAEFERWLAAPK